MFTKKKENTLRESQEEKIDPSFSDQTSASYFEVCLARSSREIVNICFENKVSFYVVETVFL